MQQGGTEPAAGHDKSTAAQQVHQRSTIRCEAVEHMLTMPLCTATLRFSALKFCDGLCPQQNNDSYRLYAEQGHH